MSQVFGRIQGNGRRLFLMFPPWAECLARRRINRTEETMVLRMIPGFVAALALAADATAQALRWTQTSSGPNPGAYGSCVAIAGDVDADGFDDVIVGDPSGGSFQDGRVEVLSG